MHLNRKTTMIKWIVNGLSALLVIVPLVLRCEAGSLINRGESWPRMPNYDIWGSPSSSFHDTKMDHQNQSSASLLTATSSGGSNSAGNSRRNGKGKSVSVEKILIILCASAGGGFILVTAVKDNKERTRLL